MIAAGKGARREILEYRLNEKQALLIAAVSAAPKPPALSSRAGPAWGEAEIMEGRLAHERVKLFKGEDFEQLEAQINRWLASLPPQINIQSRKMALATQNLSGQLIVVISVWYAESDSIPVEKLNASNDE